MSNAVYPSLIGLRAEVTRRPTWTTNILETVSGREIRGTYQIYPMYEFELSYDVLRDAKNGTDLATLTGFFLARQGSFDNFLYSDPQDSSVTAMSFGTGDGVTTQFQLTRSYGSTFTFAEPVQNVNGVPVILYGGQPANLLMNSSFESQTAGRPYGYQQYNNAGVASTYTAPAGRTGGLAYGLRADAATVDTFGIMAKPGGALDGVVWAGVRGGPFGASGISSWQPNTTYTLSWWAKKVNGATWTNMGLGWNTAPASAVFSLNPNLTTSWQQYSVTITTGANVEGTGNFYVKANGNTAINDEIHIDDMQLVFGSTAQTYVAGNQSYTYNTTGVIIFDNAPASSTALAWTGAFYYRCRFLEDKLDFRRVMLGLWEVNKVSFIGSTGNYV